MRSQLPLLAVTLCLGSVATADTDVAKDVQKAQACAACHGADGFDLSGDGVDELVAGIKSIQAGETKHPTPLTDLSDADAAEIAKILNRGF